MSRADFNDPRVAAQLDPDSTEALSRIDRICREACAGIPGANPHHSKLREDVKRSLFLAAKSPTIRRLVLDAERAILPEIVCLCGSTRFADVFVRENTRLTIEGKIVLSIGAVVSDASLGIAQDSATKRKLDELHLRKIDLADSVLVLNVDGYIGESTRREIAYATSIEKLVEYLEAPR